MLDAVAEWTGRGVAWLTLAMVLFTCFIVIARKFFDWGSIGLQESVVYMHAAVFMLGAAYALKHGAHVRVDLFFRDMSRRRQALVDLLGLLIFALPFTAFLVWVSLDYVQVSWSQSEGSREAGGLPYVYLLKTMIPLAGALLLLQGIAELIRAVAILRTHRV